jgi:hypothetical protein
MKTLLALVTSVALLAPLSGCYKSDFENEQKKSASLQGELDKAKKDLTDANSQLAGLNEGMRRLQSSGTMLVTMIDGKQVGQDGVVLTKDRYFVKHGLRVRGVNTISYTMGSLTDGPIALKREKFPDKPYITGFVKENKADGEWMWYDTAGKLTHKQTFAAGKQVSVEAATTDKTGKVTFKKLDKAAADKFFDARKDVFINIPEFSWSR